MKKSFIVSKPYHLSARLEQLVLKSKEDEKEVTRPIEDIGVLVLEHPMTTLSLHLIQQLAMSNVAVVFCNQQHMPASMSLNLHTYHAQGMRFQTQLNASLPKKKELWQQIIKQKIQNQASVLKAVGHPFQPLLTWSKKVKSGDSDNLEGRAARFYFSKLFHEDFYRTRKGPPPNNALNYGYALVRAAMARSLMASGLFPLYGIWHHNQYNAYPLADDIMEPFRPIIDIAVYTRHQKEPFKVELVKNDKQDLLKILYADMLYDNMSMPFINITERVAANLAHCLSGEKRRLVLPSLLIDQNAAISNH